MMNDFEMDRSGTVITGEQLNADVLAESITALYGDNYNNFVVLSPKTPLENSIYLQAAYNDGYILEIRFMLGKKEFKHYRYTTDKGQEAIAFFTEYMNNIVPNVTQWENVTREYI